jgi:hypothetical protein
MFIFNTLSGKASGRSGPSLGLEQKCLSFSPHIFNFAKITRFFYVFAKLFASRIKFFSNDLAHLLLLTHIFAKTHVIMILLYHKNGPFVKNAADRVFLFSKKLKEKSDFLNFSHFRKQIFDIIFAKKYESKIFRFNPTPHCFLFFAHSEIYCCCSSFYYCSRFPRSKTSTFGIPASFTNNVPIHASILNPPDSNNKGG